MATREAAATGAEFRYRYEVVAPGGIELAETLERAGGLNADRLAGQVAFPGGIHPRFIRGAHRMTESGPGEWIDNPHFGDPGDGPGGPRSPEPGGAPGSTPGSTGEPTREVFTRVDRMDVPAPAVETHVVDPAGLEATQRVEEGWADEGGADEDGADEGQGAFIDSDEEHFEERQSLPGDAREAVRREPLSWCCVATPTSGWAPCAPSS
jgi:hypothetical protein